MSVSRPPATARGPGWDAALPGVQPFGVSSYALRYSDLSRLLWRWFRGARHVKTLGPKFQVMLNLREAPGEGSRMRVIEPSGRLG